MAIVWTGQALFRKYVKPLYCERLRAMGLPIALADSLEPSEDEFLAAGQGAVTNAEKVAACQRAMEYRWNTAPEIYWWPWSELWRDA